MNYINSEYLASGGDENWKILKEGDSYSISAQSGYYGGNSANGGIIYKSNLEKGTYKMSYIGTNTHPDGSHTTCIIPVRNENGSAVAANWSGSDSDNYVHAGKTYYEYTFVVDDNFEGFLIGWWSYYRTNFRNVWLQKIG